MTRFAFADTYNDLQRLDAARTQGAITDALLQSIDGFGFQKSIAALISPQDPPRPDKPADLLFSRWSDDWIEQYAKQNYYYADPVFRRPTGPFGAARWRDVFRDTRDPVELAIVHGARECRLRDGLTFTFPLADGASAVISLAGDNIDCGESDFGRIALVSQYAIGKAISLGQEPEAAPNLTPRERDVLLWTCEGKTDWEIGAILGISEHTADKYVRVLKTKLGATSRTQLVARAFRLGIV